MPVTKITLMYKTEHPYEVPNHFLDEFNEDIGDFPLADGYTFTDWIDSLTDVIAGEEALYEILTYSPNERRVLKLKRLDAIWAKQTETTN